MARSGVTIHRFGRCRPDLGSARVYTYRVPSVLLAIRHSLAVKASCHGNSAHYRVAGAAGPPERSVFADAKAGGGQGRCRLVNIISYSSFIRWISFARPFGIAKKPYRAPYNHNHGCPVQ
jgi:hypothetical protein